MVRTLPENLAYTRTVPASARLKLQEKRGECFDNINADAFMDPATALKSAPSASETAAAKLRTQNS